MGLMEMQQFNNNENDTKEEENENDGGVPRMESII